MDKDAHLIFEAYKNKLLSEAPPAYAVGDLDIPGEKLKDLPGGGYGLKKKAEKDKQPIETITQNLVKAIQTKLFKPEQHTVDGVEYSLFYPGNEMKLRSDLQSLVQQELGVGKTDAAYTARVVRNLLNIVVKDTATGGVAAKTEKIKSAVQAAKKPTTKTETVYEIDKSVVLPEKSIKTLVINLPDEDVPEKEILSVLKTALNEYNDRPGIEPLKLKSFDLLDKLKELGVLKEKQVEKEASEGEGTGEVETIDDIPEYDDAGQAARELGYIGRGRGFDPGSFSFGD